MHMIVKYLVHIYTHTYLIECQVHASKPGTVVQGAILICCVICIIMPLEKVFRLKLLVLILSHIQGEINVIHKLDCMLLATTPFFDLQLENQCLDNQQHICTF